MGGAGGMQMSAAQMQHQQLIRSQSGGMAGSGMANSSQMQQLLSQQHQQQTLAMQQGNNQMSMQMQMSQSSSVNSVTNTGTGEFVSLVYISQELYKYQWQTNIAIGIYGCFTFSHKNFLCTSEG